MHLAEAAHQASKSTVDASVGAPPLHAGQRSCIRKASYSVRAYVARVTSRAEVEKLLAAHQLLVDSNAHIQSKNPNRCYAFRIQRTPVPGEEPLPDDCACYDGEEKGAGERMLHLLMQQNASNVLLISTQVRQAHHTSLALSKAERLSALVSSAKVLLKEFWPVVMQVYSSEMKRAETSRLMQAPTEDQPPLVGAFSFTQPGRQPPWAVPSPTARRQTPRARLHKRGNKRQGANPSAESSPRPPPSMPRNNKSNNHVIVHHFLEHLFSQEMSGWPFLADSHQPPLPRPPFSTRPSKNQTSSLDLSNIPFEYRAPSPPPSTAPALASEVGIATPQSPALRSAAKTMARLFSSLHTSPPDALASHVWQHRFSGSRQEVKTAYRKCTHAILARVSDQLHELDALARSDRPHFLVRLSFVCVAIVLNMGSVGWENLVVELTLPEGEAVNRVQEHYGFMLAKGLAHYNPFAITRGQLAAVSQLINARDFDAMQIYDISPVAFLFLEWVVLTMRVNHIWITTVDSFSALLRRAQATAAASQLRQERSGSARGSQRRGKSDASISGLGISTSKLPLLATGAKTAR